MESEVNRNFKQGIVSVPVWFRVHVSRTWVFSHAFQDPQEMNSDNRRASDGAWLRVSAVEKLSSLQGSAPLKSCPCSADAFRRQHTQVKDSGTLPPFSRQVSSSTISSAFHQI